MLQCLGKCILISPQTTVCRAEFGKARLHVFSFDLTNQLEISWWAET